MDKDKLKLSTLAPRERQQREERVYTPLTLSYEALLEKINETGILENSKPLDPVKVQSRDKSKYCKFHYEADHHIDDCGNLKEEVEYEVKKGNLCEYVEGRASSTNLVLSTEKHIHVTYSRV